MAFPVQRSWESLDEEPFEGMDVCVLASKKLVYFAVAQLSFRVSWPSPALAQRIPRLPPLLETEGSSGEIGLSGGRPVPLIKAGVAT